jgi:hypothetical protein
MAQTPMFMFATGIENSYPKIKNGRVRVDEMEKCGHYEKWRLDFDLVEEMGIRFLRYGPPIHKTFLGAGKYDWSFADLTFNNLRERDLVPIVTSAISACRILSAIFKILIFPNFSHNTHAPLPSAFPGCSFTPRLMR